MAVRKTFPSIIVRGLTKLMGEVQVRGVPIPVARHWRGLLTRAPGGQPALLPHFNTLGGEPFVHPISTGNILIRAPGLFNDLTTFVRAVHASPNYLTRQFVFHLDVIGSDEVCLRWQTFDANNTPTDSYWVRIEIEVFD